MAEPGQRDLFLVFMALAALAGMTSMALAAWSYMGWRLNRLARSLEETLDSDVPVLIRESGVPAERRLARAFNAASGAFLQVEARATHDRLTGVATGHQAIFVTRSLFTAAGGYPENRRYGWVRK
jgi:hypothetical protein